MYGYGAQNRRMPPYAPNPFASLGGKRIRIDDAKRIFLFDEASQLKSLQAADNWSFPIHFLLATTGLRPGELAHLLIEDGDVNAGWLRVTNKPELGWRVKTRRDQQVPILPETCDVLSRVIGARTAGVLFRRRASTTVQRGWTQLDLTGLIRVTERARDEREVAKGSPLTREKVAQVHRQILRLSLREPMPTTRPHRFLSAKAVAQYFGLVPRQDQSRDKNRLGHISREGPSVVRRLVNSDETSLNLVE